MKADDELGKGIKISSSLEKVSERSIGKGIIKAILFAFFVVLLYSRQVMAADADYRVMHGEQDALIVGEITEVTEEGYLVTVYDSIQCKNDSVLYRQLPKEQIPEEMRISSIRYQFSYHNKTEPGVGDYILISVDRDGDKWKQVWTALEVSGMDISTLEVAPETAMKAWTYAWQLFIRSGGEINEFAYEGEYLYVDGELVFARGAEVSENDNVKETEIVSGSTETELTNEDSLEPASFIEDNAEVDGKQNDIFIWTMCIAAVVIGVILFRKRAMLK